MCRLLGYLGQTIQLQKLIEQPDHSPIVQSYQPREMTSGLLNADGFGIGWYHPQQITEPFTYKNTIPIWNDTNLTQLNRYVESNCVLVNVRSATPGQGLDLSNCQPFTSGSIMAIHNGFIENFRKSLYRPIRNQLNDQFYQGINGTTDSEHIFALLLHNLKICSELTLVEVLQKTLIMLIDLAREYDVRASLNLIISDGKQLVASRASSHAPAPSLYWLPQSSDFPNAVVIASEPICQDSNWIGMPERSILSIDSDLNAEIKTF